MEPLSDSNSIRKRLHLFTKKGTRTGVDLFCFEERVKVTDKFAAVLRNIVCRSIEFAHLISVHFVPRSVSRRQLAECRRNCVGSGAFDGIPFSCLLSSSFSLVCCSQGQRVIEWKQYNRDMVCISNENERLPAILRCLLAAESHFNDAITVTDEFVHSFGFNGPASRGSSMTMKIASRKEEYALFRVTSISRMRVSNRLLILAAGAVVRDWCYFYLPFFPTSRPRREREGCIERKTLSQFICIVYYY